MKKKASYPAKAIGKTAVKEANRNKKKKTVKNKTFREAQLLRALVDSLPIGLCIKDLHGRFSLVNRSMAQLMGATAPGELLGKTDFDVYPREIAEKQHADALAIIQTGQSRINRPSQHADATGKLQRHLLTQAPLRNRQKRIIGIVGMACDAAESQRMGSSLSNEGYLLDVLLNTIPDAIYFKDRDSRFIRNSKSLTNRFGIADPAELTGKRDFDFFSLEHAQQAYDDEQQIIRTGKPLIGIEEKETFPDGSVKWVSTTKMPLKDETGKTIGTFGISRDITRQKLAEIHLQEAMESLERVKNEISEKAEALQITNRQIEQTNKELDQSNHELEQARKMLTSANRDLQHMNIKLKNSNQELEQFAYVASHDLQEPLRMVSSYTSLLEKRNREKLDADSREFIDFAVDGTKRMQQLINDLLNYSRVTTQGKPFEPTDVEKVFGRVLKNLEVAIGECGAKVTHDPLPVVQADPVQMERLLQNLVGNAIKYKEPHSHPEVHVSAEKEGNERVFSIRDNGIGINPKYFDKVFGIFQRLHTRNQFSGTGIGLAVCKKIVERHGGRIWVESEGEGKGTTFYFTLSDARE